jgi:(p)ppGpp synthase/HD superfamily hydrolase
MLAMGSLDEWIVAVLHDVIEDTDWTIGRLRQEGFSETVLLALDALTKREGEEYLAYVRRAGANLVASRVKLADLADNMDLARISSPTDRDRERLKRYESAIELLEALEISGRNRKKTGQI